MSALGAIGGLLRAAFMVAMQYRASFLAELVMAVAGAGWTLVPLFVLFQQTPALSGWTWEQGILVVGFFTLMEGLLGALVEPNLGAVVQHVRMGTFDFLLLKPLDTQLYVSLHRVAPTRLPHAAVGLGLVAYGAAQAPPSPAAWLAAGGLLLAGLTLLHSLWTLVVCTSFWFVRVDNLSHLLRAVLDAGRWPIEFYRGIVRVVLTFIVPVGLMTTWPALALRGELSAQAGAIGVGVALGFALLARVAWVGALRHYSSASS